MNPFFTKTLLISTFVLTAPLLAHEPWSSGRPDGHAPIAVMGDHMHHKGEWMLSYRFMFMEMEGNRDGTTRLEPEDILTPGGEFLVTPLRMTMEMHMFGVMYAPGDRLTFMGMLNYASMKMDHVIGNPPTPMPFPLAGREFTTRSEGVGDIMLTAMYSLFNKDGQSLHLNFGLSLPTGSIDEQDFIPLPPPSGSTPVLPYPMQLGSGTYDLVPGITWLWQREKWSGGAQAKATFRLGENDAGYTLGDRFMSTAWVSGRWNDWLSSSLRLEFQTWGDIDGVDSRISQVPPFPVSNFVPYSVPTARPDLRGGDRLDFSMGTNLYIRKGPFKGHRLAVEVSLPVYQNLDGPQLEVDLVTTVGWQFAW